MPLLAPSTLRASWPFVVQPKWMTAKDRRPPRYLANLQPNQNDTCWSSPPQGQPTMIQMNNCAAPLSHNFPFLERVENFFLCPPIVVVTIGNMVWTIRQCLFCLRSKEMAERQQQATRWAESAEQLKSDTHRPIFFA